MLETDARRLAAAIEERVNTDVAGPGITAKVQSDRTVPRSIPAGAGRPAFISYHIQIDDGTRAARLDLDQAAALLDDIEPDWDLDQIFDAIRSQGAPIEDSKR
ncbi:MAG: hypothetical protein ACRDZO_00015 [Egibacteraceae bacterium]